MNLFKKTTDIIQEKEGKLLELAAQTADAVDLVTRTICNLESVNEEINSTVTDIEIYQKRLEAVGAALKNNRTRNAAVITNFKKLLEC